MPPDIVRSSRRSRQARLILLVLFGALRLGDVGLLKFSFWAGNPIPFSRGIVLGGVLVSAVLFWMIGMRRAWARYLLIGVNWLMVTVFCSAAVMLVDTGFVGMSEPLKAMGGGLLLYVVVNTTLIISSRIQRFATAPGVGG